MFDCFDGSLLEYFKRVTGITAELPSMKPRSIIDIIEDIWQNRDRAYNTKCLIKRLHRIDKTMAGEARQSFAAFIPDGDVARFARELPRRLHDDFTATMAILRDSELQNLLLNYPRPKRIFMVAYETEDTVESEWLIHDGEGNERKPEDYLKAFARFVQENPVRIDAISVLLDRPQDWSTDALAELQQKLSTTSDHFTVPKLQRAHERHYRKALVDVISMVKHAADEQIPLYTAEERVDHALGAVIKGQTFTPAQRQWLDRIRAHLIENLSIEQDDFDVLPVFARHGGWGKADKTFGGELSDLVRRVNEAIAA